MWNNLVWRYRCSKRVVGFSWQTHVKRPFVSKDVRKRELQLEKDRQRKRAAYAKQKAELEEYKAALKDRSTAKSDDNCNCSLRLSETQIFKSNSFRKKMHIIYCEPQINQSQWASLAEVLSQMSCRTLPKGSRSSTKLCRNRPVRAMVRPCPHKKYATQNLQPGSSPGRLRGAPPSAGDISVQTFSKKYSFRKSCFRTGPLPKRNSGKHSRRCASRVPSNSFIHSCMSCLK